MIRVVLPLALAACAAISAAAGGPAGTRVQLSVADRREIRALTDLVSIDDVRGLEVTAWATAAQLERLRELGYTWRELPTPDPVAPGPPVKVGDTPLTGYPAYADYVAMMHGLAAGRPDICRLHRIGWSQMGREVLVLQITDHPEVEEDEPEVYLSATMHGNEATGMVLLLDLAADLLARRADGPADDHEARVSHLVDSLEIWINPLANPDGYVAGSRYFASGRDPNRDFPDAERGDTPDPELFDGDPETLDQMRFAESRTIVLSANLHDGVEVVNYPWDTWPRRHADEPWFLAVSHAYADACRRDWTGPGAYMDGFDDGVTNGWSWYEANGTRQDYMVFFRGGREVTIEVAQSQPAPEWLLAAHWDAHREAMLDYLGQALRGVRGLVTDHASGRPVAATVGVVGHDRDGSEVLTDPQVGDYHRMIGPGTYTLAFSAHAYQPVVVEGVEVPTAGDAAVRVDVELRAIEGAVASLSGTVSAALGGAPLAGASVEILELGGRVTDTTGADGTFLLGPLMPGLWTFRVRRAGYRTVQTERVVTETGASTDFVLSRDPTRHTRPVGAEPAPAWRR